MGGTPSLEGRHGFLEILDQLLAQQEQQGPARNGTRTWAESSRWVLVHQVLWVLSWWSPVQGLKLPAQSLDWPEQPGPAGNGTRNGTGSSRWILVLGVLGQWSPVVQGLPAMGAGAGGQHGIEAVGRGDPGQVGQRQGRPRALVQVT